MARPWPLGSSLCMSFHSPVGCHGAAGGQDEAFFPSLGLECSSKTYMPVERIIDPGSRVSGHEITRLLKEWRAGDREALDSLLPLVYQELRQVARRQMRKEGAVTLQPTALVHEAYLRMTKIDVDWQDRAHFFALASSMMRRILVDEAKRRRAVKRGRQETLLFMEELDGALRDTPTADLVALDQAMTRLGDLDARKLRVVELRFFAGMTIAECAEVLGVGHATIERDLKMARAWLLNRMKLDSRGSG